MIVVSSAFSLCFHWDQRILVVLLQKERLSVGLMIDGKGSK